MNHKVKTTADIQQENAQRIQELVEAHPECTGEPIIHFDGQYKFLSNFYQSPFEVHGYSFDNGEAGFQGFKDLSRVEAFATIKPSKAKWLGRQVQLRPDWEEVKNSVMEDVVRAKFKHNAELKQRLLATGDRLLIEGNWWNDKIWGVSNGKGENRLGIILMKVRKEIKEHDGIMVYV